MIDTEDFNTKVMFLVNYLVGTRLAQNNGLAEIVMEGREDNYVPTLPYAHIQPLLTTNSGDGITNTRYNDVGDKVYETYKDISYSLTFHGDIASVKDTAELCNHMLKFDSTSEYVYTSMRASVPNVTGVVPIINILSNRRRYTYTFDITFRILDVTIDTNAAPQTTGVGVITTNFN